MKLTKAQVKAIAQEVYDTAYSNVSKYNQEQTEKAQEKFFKTKEGKLFKEYHEVFKENARYSQHIINKYTNVENKKYPSLCQIERSIIFETISPENFNVEEFIQKLVDKFSQ